MRFESDPIWSKLLIRLGPYDICEDLLVNLGDDSTFFNSIWISLI